MHKIILPLLFFPVLALAEVHKCVNGGNVSYSEKPCVSGAVAYDANRVSIGDSTVRSASIVRGSGGVFKSVGSVNGQSVEFIIDTGATSTTLSGAVAYRLGVHSCVPVGITRTANGDTATCRAVVSRLSIAGFNFVNVPVAVLPGMASGALFGNDLLSKFTVIQHGDVITLSR